MSFEVDEQVFTHVGTGMPVNKSFKIQVASLVSLNGDDIDTVLGVTV
jgi:hypothetical protein